LRELIQADFMRRSLSLLFVLVALVINSNAQARLEVCNQTDLVLMVVVGYDTGEGRIASEGWWRIYPGSCEVPIDVSFLSGNYYLHAESNPRSTMPIDGFSWGSEKTLCVKQADFRIPDATQCQTDNIAVKFDSVGKNWRNLNKIDISHSKRQYKNTFRAKIAGIQRMLSILGYDIGIIDGFPGKKTVDALNEIGQANGVFGFDFAQIFPLLEELIAQKQKLDN